MRKRPDYGDATPEDVARALLKRKRRATDTPDGGDPPTIRKESELRAERPDDGRRKGPRR